MSSGHPPAEQVGGAADDLDARLKHLELLRRVIEAAGASDGGLVADGCGWR
jgi:hypothetical protein